MRAGCKGAEFREKSARFLLMKADKWRCLGYLGHMPLLIIALIALTFAFYFGRRAWRRRRMKADLLRKPLTARDWQIIEAEVPLTLRLPHDLRAKLEGKVNLFLGQVEFIGCDGLEVDDGMRLAIAAQAALLVVNSDAWYDHLTTVMIYPGAFKSIRAEMDGYVVTERETVRTGESWTRGPVILSWQDSEQGALNIQDGHNVVLHEFAHQLDDLSGQTDGAPLLSQGQSFAEWARVMTQAYDRHLIALEKRRRTVIDPYGAEGHQEFFAVAVEAFFERSEALRDAEPEVYAQMVALLRVDPATW